MRRKKVLGYPKERRRLTRYPKVFYIVDATLPSWLYDFYKHEKIWNCEKLSSAQKKRIIEIEKAISTYSLEFELDPMQLRALMAKESSFNPNARSPKGALGLMQLLPETFHELWSELLKQKSTKQSKFPIAQPKKPSPTNISHNTRAGAFLFSKLLLEFSVYGEKQSFELALAAYNCGPNRIRRLLSKLKDSQNYAKEIPRETRNHITVTNQLVALQQNL
ncbi:MAG: transglycosylase SLT domain-containing protein, partial [Candidatus Micrarchaeota archaeon]